MNNLKRIILDPPNDPKKEDYIGYNCGIRPARKGGFRLEKETKGQKTFYHNYGHSRSGVTIGYGCSKFAVHLFVRDFGDYQKPIAIIGAGYMGMYTAFILSSLGYKINVYADFFPSKNTVFNNDNRMTSQIAAGLILPVNHETFPNQALHYLMAKDTIEFYKNMHESKQFKGISYKDYFTTNEETVHSIPKDLIDPIEKVLVTFDNQRFMPAFKSRVLLVEGDLFLPDLMKECVKRGVQFIERHFKDIDSIMELTEEVVFNCTGFQSKYLFNDSNLYSNKGVIVYLRNQTQMNYFLNVKDFELSLYPLHDRMGIGEIVIPNQENIFEEKENLKEVARIKANYREFYNKWVKNPSLL